MPHLEVDIDTALPPERVREALLDFSDRRPDIWPGLERSLYVVYEVGESSADVREGSRLPGTTIWAREHYDWSDPDTVRWTVMESNFCTPDSRVYATLRPKDGGGTRIHLDWDRTATTFVGRLLFFLITATKGKPLTMSVEKALRKMGSEEPPAF
jgi:Polyketide cyclase / dehydrase and lipid transport